jgi:D-lactate dehydrogenase (cytochrome)
MSIAALRAAATSAGLVQDLKTLLAIVRSAASPVLGLMQGARVALAGRRFLNRPAEHAAHFVVEGHGLREISGQLAAVRAAARRFGSEMPNTAPMAMRAAPFNTYDMLNIDGRRQLPFHGILPWSQAAPFNRAYRAVLDAEAARLARMEMSVISVYSGISTNGLLFEPVILWPDVAEAFHRRHSSAAALARIKATAPNLEARAYAADLRERIVALMFDHGAVHLQIGKTYPYLRERSPAQAALLRGVKQMMDPNGLINPGALGLG